MWFVWFLAGWIAGWAVLILFSLLSVSKKSDEQMEQMFAERRRKAEELDSAIRDQVEKSPWN